MNLRMYFQGWLVQTLGAKNQESQTRLQEAEARTQRPTSIWTMRKQDLLVVLQDEVEVPIHLGEKMTVIEIRETIKTHRQERAAAIKNHAPALPKGMSRMTKDALKEECVRRGLIHPDAKLNRAQMMLKLREQVAGVMQWGDRDDPPCASPEQSPSASAGRQ